MSRDPVRALLLVLTLLACAASGTRAQAPQRHARFVLPADDAAPSPARAFLLSALLPGSAQAALDSERWIPYVVAEAWAWTTFADRALERERLERRYRDVAWSVARRISAGERHEREFEYYEAMARFAASGAYDASPDLAGVQPEADASTYNGSIWQLARDLHLPPDGAPVPGTPAYQRALDYYRANAVQPAFAWSWEGYALQHQVFRELIDRSDEAARSATLMLGVILANHVLSAVDALVAARLRNGDEGAGGAGSPLEGLRLRGAIVPLGGRLHWLQAVELPIP